MWPFDRHTSRRREIRRDKVERGLTLAQQLRERVRFAPVAIATVSAALSALILNIGGEPLGIYAGQRLHRAITARIDFQIEDGPQTRAKQERARQSSPNHYRLDASLVEAVRGRLMWLLNQARAHADDPRAMRELAAKNNIVLDDDGVAELIEIAARSSTASFEDSIDRAVRSVQSQPLIEESAQAQQQTALDAVLFDGETGKERSVPVTDLLPPRPESVERIARDAAGAFTTRLRESIRMTVGAVLRGGENEPVKPLYRFDANKSAFVANKAAESVKTQYIAFRQYGVLADVGPVNQREVELVAEERKAYHAATALDHDIGRVMQAEALGRALLAVLVTVGLVGFVYRFKPRGRDLPVRQFITAFMLLALLASTRVMTLLLPETPVHVVIGAQAIAAAVLSIVYARVLIFGICGGLAILVTLATQQGIDLLITLLAVSGTFVIGLRNVRNRGQIVGIGAIAALIAFLSTTAAGVMAGQSLGFITWQAAWAGGATLAAAFIVEGVLPAIERLFGVTTNMTMLEWCDANKPLLRMLAAEAPGTYNHSLLVGALAEAAAESIGANGLMARAGAYYHDIGKVNKPEYFVENQPRNVSRHDRLSPAMSVLVIINHVKDGIEMAKEYRIPPILHSFIAEHHGTTLVEYFYHRADELRKPDDPEVDESEFRYPGPKPQSRETAVVMLCDGVEGAVRAMPEPTPGRIESVVQEIVRKRLLDGQLDECDINFRELATIEKSLIKSLCGIYHARIEYPEEREEREKERRAKESRSA